MPLLDAFVGLVMLAVGVAGVIGIVYGFRTVARFGRSWAWLARVLTGLFVVVSSWGLVRAVAYDNTHRYPNGQATAVGEGFMFVHYCRENTVRGQS